jgi:WD40 repeat protein
LLKLWDLSNGELRANLAVPEQHPAVSSLAFSADGKRMAGATGCESFKRERCHALIWEMPSGKELHAFELPGMQQFPVIAFIPPDEKRLAVACAGGRKHGITIHDITSGEIKADLITSHCAMATALAVSPDGSTIASVEVGWTTEPVKVPYQQLALWRIPTGELLATSEAQVEEITSLAAFPDSKRFLSVDGRNAMIWDGATGRKLHSFGTLSRTRSVGLSADGKMFAAGLENGAIQLWDLTLRGAGPPPIPK